MSLGKKIECTLIALLFVVIIPLNALSITCNPEGALSKREWSGFDKAKTIISVPPFTDQSKNPSKGWLGNGLSELIGDYLTAGKEIAVVKGIVRKVPPAVIKPHYKIVGSYQESPRELMISINVFKTENQAQPVHQAVFVIPTNSGRLFFETERAARNIFKALGLGFDKKALEEKTSQTTNYMAYKAYIKGLEAMWSFDIEMADRWFGEARRNDIYFQGPYQARETMCGYLALKAKIEGKPYSHYLKTLEETEDQRLKFKNRPSPIPSEKPRVIKKSKETSVTNRFLNGNAHFIAGETALRNGNLKEAKEELETTIKLVPEDTMAMRELFNTLSKMGKPKEAAQIQNLIAKQGLCF